jgi:hypothetical protein
MKKILFFIASALIYSGAAFSATPVSVKNGINWDKNGNPVCTYGAIKSCQTAAAYGDSTAKAYVKQIQNSKKPVAPTPVKCTGVSCKPVSLPACSKAFPHESGFWGQYKAFKRCV